MQLESPIHYPSSTFHNLLKATLTLSYLSVATFSRVYKRRKKPLRLKRSEWHAWVPWRSRDCCVKGLRAGVFCLVFCLWVFLVVWWRWNDYGKDAVLEADMGWQSGREGEERERKKKEIVFLLHLLFSPLDLLFRQLSLHPHRYLTRKYIVFSFLFYFVAFPCTCVESLRRVN